MPLYRWTDEAFDAIPVRSFEEEGLQERRDLQPFVRDQPEVLEDGLFILDEEFSNWEDSQRSIDLLGLDRDGRLVVIELKRTQSGDHMELQAIRYAAMVANMTVAQMIDAHRTYLEKMNIEEDAEIRLCEHLKVTYLSEAYINSEKPRIILASAGFSTELTTSVLWLNQSGLDITCIRMQLYRNGEEVFMDINQVVPLPEASEYLVRVRDREQEASSHSSGGVFTQGGEVFLQSIDSAPISSQETLRRVYQWAVNLQNEGLCNLGTYVTRRQGEVSLLPRLSPDNAGLVTLYKANSGCSIQFWRSVFQRRAPRSIISVEEIISEPIRQGNTLLEISEDLLSALTNAYREANGQDF